MQVSPVEWIVVGIVAVVLYLTFKGRGSSSPSTSGPLICADCGTRGDSRTQTRGNILIEIILWLCFILPGLIYSIWRRSNRSEVCPACGHASMIPVGSPRGRQLVEQFASASGPSKQVLP